MGPSRTTSGVDRLAKMQQARRLYERITEKQGVKLQVQKANGWQDLGALEMKGVCTQLTGGELRFPVVNSGTMYFFDFSDPDDIIQENMTKKRKFKVRIYDEAQARADRAAERRVAEAAASAALAASAAAATLEQGQVAENADPVIASGRTDGAPRTRNVQARNNSPDGGSARPRSASKERQPRGGHQPKLSKQGPRRTDQAVSGGGGGNGSQEGQTEQLEELVGRSAAPAAVAAGAAPRSRASTKSKDTQDGEDAGRGSADRGARGSKASSGSVKSGASRKGGSKEAAAAEQEAEAEAEEECDEVTASMQVTGQVCKDIQEKYGPQSKRGKAPQDQLTVLRASPHAMGCFESFARNEKSMCGEWACFYHSYSCAALLYEVQAAVANILFRFRSQFAPLPRLMLNEFENFEDVTDLIATFEEKYQSKKQDHDPEYRKVAISAMCSLVALGPEASTPVVFMHGYSEQDTSFVGVLESILEACGIPKAKMNRTVKDLVQISEKHSLDVSDYGGKKCASGKSGHMMQICVHRSLVDNIVYASKPFGLVDPARHPISAWVDSDANMNFGQARILAHPRWFMQADCVRMYCVSSDETFHNNRVQFQRDLCERLNVILAEPSVRLKAATRIYGTVAED